VCTSGKEGHLHCGLHQEEDSQQVEESGGSFPLSGTCETASLVLCPVLDSPTQKRL